MKVKILKLLQTKFNGVDEKILDRIATKLAKTVTSEDDVQTAVDGVTIQTLLESFGDQRANEASKTAVANYEKKHKLKDGKVVEEPKTPEGEEVDPDMPAWAKALVESNKALQAQLESINADKVATTRKTKLDELLKDAPDSVKKMYEGSFTRMSFKDDADFDGWLEGAKPEIEGLVNDYKAKGAVFHRPMGSATQKTKDGINPALKAMYEQQEQNQVYAQQAATRVMGMPASAPAARPSAPAQE